MRWSWTGAAIFVLALALGGGWATALVMSASSRTPPISDSTKDLLGTIGGGLVGVIGTYVGGSVARKRRDDDDKRDDDDDASPS